MRQIQHSCANFRCKWDHIFVDDATVTSEVLTIDQVVAECAEACSTNNDVEEEEEKLPEPAFTLAVVALDLMRRYVRPSDNEIRVKRHRNGVPSSGVEQCG